VLCQPPAYVAVDEEQNKPITGTIKTRDITAAMVEQERRLSWRGGERGSGGGGMMRKKHKHKDEYGDFPQMRSRAMPAPLSTRTESGVNTQYTEARHYVRQIHV